MRRLSFVLVGLMLAAGAACTDGGGDATAAPTQPTSSGSTSSTTAAARPGQPAKALNLAEVEIQPLAAVTDGSSLWLAGSGPRGGRVARVSLETARPVWALDIPNTPVGLAVSSAGVLFAVGGGDGGDHSGGITRLDAESGNTLGALDLPAGSPYGVAAAPHAVWVTDSRSDRVWRLDPQTGAVKDTVKVPAGPTAIAYAGDSVWVASPRSRTVTRLDVSTGALRRTVSLPTPNSVKANSSAVWVGGEGLVRLDPQTGEQTGRIATAPPGLVTVQAFGSGWVWAHRVGGDLVRGETDGLRLDAEPIASGEFVVAVTAGDSLWVSDGTRLAEWRLPLPTTLDFPAETTRDGKNFGYVRGVEANEVIFDPAEELTGPRATAAALADGIGISKEEGLPNGFYDRNRDGRTHRLPLRADAQLLLMKATDPGFGPVHVDRATFVRALTDTTGDEFYGLPGAAPFRLTVENGAVTRLENIYRP